MKNIKCIIMLILAIVLSTALFSCGEYSNAVGGGEGGGGAAVGVGATAVTQKLIKRKNRRHLPQQSPLIVN